MNDYNYEAAYWYVHRKLEDLKGFLTIIISISISVAYLIRFFILGSSEEYMKMAKAWDMVDLIAMMFTFFGLMFSISKILNFYFATNEIVP